MGDIAVGEVNGASGGFDETREHAEEGGFTATRRAEKEEESAGGNVEVDLIDGTDGVEGFGEVAQGEREHLRHDNRGVWSMDKDMGKERRRCGVRRTLSRKRLGSDSGGVVYWREVD